MSEIGKELVDIHGRMNRLPREPEDESDEIVETEKKPNGPEKEWRVDWRCYEGKLGVERGVDAEL